MSLGRRAVLKGGAAAACLALLPSRGNAQQGPAGAIFAPKPGNWRTFEITTTVELPAGGGKAQVWVPVPSFVGDGWMKPGESTWKISGGEATLAKDPAAGAAMVHAIFAAGDAKAAIEVKSLVTTRDRAVDLSRPSGVPDLTADERKRYTSASELIPTDGLVAETSAKIVDGSANDLEKARRIYQWVVENTFRDPKTRGCGTGDIASMLKSGNLGGKCADLNALYVGLARAAGLPARDVYGIRVAPSAFGYKSLGANAAIISKAQHCRAEVFLSGIGWVPADPADVRKVVLEEPPGNLAADDAKVMAARAALFGAWETNWMAYNDAHDVTLPGSSGKSVPFLMYPQGEKAGAMFDPLEPDTFKYVISAKEITA
jgi:transglutaminase-like putative cysteine protease